MRVFYEADLPAQQSAAPAHSRVPRAHADPLGSRGDLGAAAQGAQETLGVSSGLVRLREKFSRDDRLRKRREFEECYAAGVRVSGRHLQLFLLPPGPNPRLGISVPRRVGEAVQRNLLRRRVRELFRRNRELFGTAGGNLVVNVRPSAAGATFAELAEDYRSSLSKILARTPRPPKRPAQ